MHGINCPAPLSKRPNRSILSPTFLYIRENIYTEPTQSNFCRFLLSKISELKKAKFPVCIGHTQADGKARSLMQNILFSGFYLFILALTGFSAGARAQSTCAAMDRPCLMKQIETLAPTIDKTEWKDQTLRELAKTYAYEGETAKAIALIGKITDNDTKAMTIRGIGMAAAGLKWERRRYSELFAKLSEEALKISHTPSRGIAFTYISMAQAFAGDDDAARQTAAGMENIALRNKAYGEAAEIQADRGDLSQAVKSLSAIDSAPYRNKQYDIVSRIFLDKAMVEEAYACAGKINNAYLKAKSIQRILNKGNADEADMEPKNDLAKDF